MSAHAQFVSDKVASAKNGFWAYVISTTVSVHKGPKKKAATVTLCGGNTNAGDEAQASEAGLDRAYEGRDGLLVFFELRRCLPDFGRGRLLA